MNRIAALAKYMRRQAENASQASKMMAEAKSLRQNSNVERRADLYSWSKPEKTIEWEIAELLSNPETLTNAIWDKLNTIDTAPGEGDFIATYAGLKKAVGEALGAE